MSYMGEQPIFGQYPTQLLSGNGVLTSFTLTYSPASPSTLLVTISGVKQQATAYSVTDTTIDFGAGNAPPSGTNNIEILYLGQRSDVGTVADDSITLAKMANLARGKIIVGDSSGDPSALTVGSADQVLKSDGTDVAWGADAGITDCSQWILDTGFTSSSSSEQVLTANLSEPSGDGYGRLGSAMTESSGNFTFPSTGYWFIDYNITFYDSAVQDHMMPIINTTTDNSTYTRAADASCHITDAGTTMYATAGCNFLFDVTSTSLCKVQFAFKFVGKTTGYLGGSAAQNVTYFTFTRLGDT